MKCTVHVGSNTLLQCNKCGKPFCTKCLTDTPSGARCRVCADNRPLPQFVVSLTDLGKSASVSIALGLIIGILFHLVASVVPWHLHGLLYLFGLSFTGFLIGETISFLTNRKRAVILKWIAGGGTSFCWLSFHILQGSIIGLELYLLVGLIVGSALAVSRIR